MPGSYLLHNDLHYNGLMTDWGYILNKLGLIKHEKEMLQKRVLQHLLLWIGMEGGTRLLQRPNLGLLGQIRCHRA